MDSDGLTLRERRRVVTQQTIQLHAMRLFVERGYDNTTVIDVAQAAGVSPMTVYRNFPTKEDLVLSDEYDPVIAERVAARPAEEPLMRRIGMTLVDEVGRVLRGAEAGSGQDGAGHSLEVAYRGRDLLLARLKLVLATPALRARRWDGQFATQTAIVEALQGDSSDPDCEFRLSVAAGACLSAVGVALIRWANEDGRPDLRQLMIEALAVLSDGQFDDELKSEPRR
jgi:AcrR family transcriptional regulator